MSLAFDSWMLGAEAASVIAMRTARLAMGGAAAQAEAQRMVSEKALAAFALGADLASGKLGSTPETIARRTVAHYGKRVRANRRRLSKA
jgi:hypothetical protein